VDFCAPEQKVIVELDGGQHGLDEEKKRDEERTARIERCGYRVMRFWNFEVLQNLGGVLEAIAGAVEGKRTRASPSP
jgi:very-short-patch-repair endonuclease